MHLDAGGTVSESLLSWNLLRFVFFFSVSQPNREPRAPMPLSWERAKKKKNTPGSWSATPALRYAVAVKLIEPTARAHHQRHPFMFRACGRARSANQLRMAWIGLDWSRMALSRAETSQSTSTRAALSGARRSDGDHCPSGT